MRFRPGSTLKNGLIQLAKHPQIWLTVVVAVAIVGSFVFLADRFIGIARDAQDRLVNVRVGSLQDAFTPLAAAFISDPVRLRGYMQEIASENPTITDFQIAEATTTGWVTALAVDQSEIGKQLTSLDFLISLAKADPRNSFTIEEVNDGERYFRTARAIVDASSSIVGIALTKQTLSQADQSIAASITTSIYVLVSILALLLILFFHHARIIDYTALYRRLKEVDSLKDDFIGMASHELRAPLTLIRGYVAELKERYGGSGGETGMMIDRIDRSAENLNLLVADILDVARIEQGHMSFAMKTIDPAPLIQELCDAQRVVAIQKGLTLSAQLTSGLHISIDETRLRQIVTNFISNAVKYSDKGEIIVSFKREKENAELRVSDTGIGMTADEQAQLFGKFRRAAGERVRSEVGTGLGLWITKQLVEAMGGKISVESIKGVGSHFIVSFPLVA